MSGNENVRRKGEGDGSDEIENGLERTGDRRRAGFVAYVRGELD